MVEAIRSSSGSINISNIQKQNTIFSNYCFATFIEKGTKLHGVS